MSREKGVTPTMKRRGPGFSSSSFTWLFRYRFGIAKLWGIQVSVHWTWIPTLVICSVFEKWGFQNHLWTAAEFLCLFAIVLFHELGHAVAARSLGWPVREIILWPLGGFALIEPKSNRANQLLVVSAGPLVNLILTPILFWIWWMIGYERGGDISRLLWNIAWANLDLLLFNLLPIWPMDGGQIVYTALRNRIGTAKSGIFVGISGIACAAIAITCFMHTHAYIAVALMTALIWFEVGYLQRSLVLNAAELNWGFHESAECPECHHAALDRPQGNCATCGENFNFLSNKGKCWNCGAEASSLRCPYCWAESPVSQWLAKRRADSTPTRADPVI
jgi:Zn-dependent protease